MTASESALRTRIQALAESAVANPDSRYDTASEAIQAICRAMNAADQRRVGLANAEEACREVNELAMSLAVEMLGRMIEAPAGAALLDVHQLIELRGDEHLAVLAVLLQGGSGHAVKVSLVDRNSPKPDAKVSYPLFFEIPPPRNGTATFQDVDALLWALHDLLYGPPPYPRPPGVPMDATTLALMTDKLTSELSGAESYPRKVYSVAIYCRDRDGAAKTLLLQAKSRMHGVPVAHLNGAASPLKFLLTPDQIATLLGRIYRNWLPNRTHA